MTTNDLRWTDSYAEAFSPHGYRAFLTDGRRIADGKLADVLKALSGYSGWQVYAVHSTGAAGSLVLEDEYAQYDRDWKEALEPDGTYRTDAGETVTHSTARITGEPGWSCSGCSTRFVYVEHPTELEHDCENL